jgi:magnesium transporter
MLTHNSVRSLASSACRPAETESGSIVWHDICDPKTDELDRLAERYRLHLVHVKDCRTAGQRAKVEVGDRYLFIVLKTLVLETSNLLAVSDLSLFVGSEFLITVHSAPIPTVESLRQGGKDVRADEVLYRLMDGVVDSYLPLLDEIQVRIDTLQGRAIRRTERNVPEQINELRGTLIALRRVLLSMRHVAFRLQHIRSEVIGCNLPPFLRDIYHHLAEDLDTIAGERDRLAGILDLYLASVANEHTEAMRALTLLGTAVLPALVISSFLGMNIRMPWWTNSASAFEAVTGATILLTLLLWRYLERRYQ